MTSFRQYDYNIAINIFPDVFRDIAGVALDVDIIDNVQRHLPGMLIIPHSSPSGPANIYTPQIKDYSKREISLVEAWMWVYDSVDITLGTEIVLTLGQPCDPAMEHLLGTGIHEDAAMLHKGLSLKGSVEKNRRSKSPNQQYEKHCIAVSEIEQ